MDNMTSVWTLTAGQKVEGIYYGVTYRGTVNSLRAHTMNHHIALVDVTMDRPITVFGMPRSEMQFSVSDDQRKLAHYLGGCEVGYTMVAL